jgi:hypothetical protein
VCAELTAQHYPTRVWQHSKCRVEREEARGDRIGQKERLAKQPLADFFGFFGALKKGTFLAWTPKKGAWGQGLGVRIEKGGNAKRFAGSLFASPWPLVPSP